jgi:hypothetical protein
MTFLNLQAFYHRRVNDFQLTGQEVILWLRVLTGLDRSLVPLSGENH